MNQYPPTEQDIAEVIARYISYEGLHPHESKPCGHCKKPVDISVMTHRKFCDEHCRKRHARHLAAVK